MSESETSETSESEASSRPKRKPTATRVRIHSKCVFSLPDIVYSSVKLQSPKNEWLSHCGLAEPPWADSWPKECICARELVSI